MQNITARILGIKIYPADFSIKKYIITVHKLVINDRIMGICTSAQELLKQLHLYLYINIVIRENYGRKPIPKNVEWS